MKQYIAVRDRLLTDDKTLKSKTDAIFKTLGEYLGMTPNSVHLNISRNMEQIFGNDYVSKSMTKKLANDEDDLEWNHEDMDGMSIRVQLSDDQKRAFDLIPYQGKTRLYKTLKIGWTDSLAAIIESSGVLCIVTFKNYNLVGTEFTAMATCQECNGTIGVESLNERTELVMHIKYGPNQHTQTKRRRLTAAKADAIREQLKSKSVHAVYTSQSDDISIVFFWSKEQQFYYSQIKSPWRFNKNKKSSIGN